MSMPLIVSCSIFAYLIATACAILIMFRTSNWRIRFLAFSIGLAPLCQSVILLGNERLWITPNMMRMVQFLQLSDSALCLAALYLLNQVNLHGKKTEAQLRVVEAN